jgi:hypothetical protein
MGTFTSLQDEAGRTLGGINSEDEPLPRFTHDIDHLLVLKKNNLPARFYQGAPASLPRVTMRLETPVVYFYPPAGSKLPLALDGVRADAAKAVGTSADGKRQDRAQRNDAGELP